jgi:hypothetical protein
MRLAGVSSFSVSFAGFCRTSHSSFSVRCSSVHRFVLAGAFPRFTRGVREDHDHHHHQQGHASRAAAERAVPVSRRLPARTAEVARGRAGLRWRRAWPLPKTRNVTQFKFDTNNNGLSQIQERDMTITIINKGTKRDQQQNGPCPYLVDCPPEPRR